MVRSGLDSIEVLGIESPAGAVGAEQAEHLAGANAERDAVDRVERQFGVALDELIDDHEVAVGLAARQRGCWRWNGHHASEISARSRAPIWSGSPPSRATGYPQASPETPRCGLNSTSPPFLELRHARSAAFARPTRAAPTRAPRPARRAIGAARGAAARGAPAHGAAAEPPPSGDGPGSRVSNAFYSIRIPDGFEDVTDSYRTQHPAERSTVQAFAGQTGSLVTPDASIVISRLPSGADRGRSLDQLAADQVRALQHEGASGAGTPRHSTIGADPAVEVDLSIRSGGQPQRRTQVLCIHDGRLWQIAVTSPTGSQSQVTAAWTTVKNGWQW